MKWGGFMIACLACLCACGDASYYSDEYLIQNERWPHDQRLDFTFEIKDTSTRFSIVLDLVHAPEYLYQNTYLKIYTSFPDGRELDQVLPVDFANQEGQWHAKCRGQKCRLRIVMQEHAYFDQSGTHTISIEQYTRDNPLEHIRSVTLKLFEES